MYASRTGSFCSRDPIGYEAHGHNLYGYAVVNPLNYTDPTGTDIYLETGNNTNSPINNRFHQNICVDVWDGPCSEGKEPSSKVCFSFGANFSRCGEDGCFLVGETYITDPVPTATVSQKKKTTCEQDRAFFLKLFSHRNHSAPYNAKLNCRSFSQGWFNNAPGTEIPKKCVRTVYNPHTGYTCVEYNF